MREVTYCVLPASRTSHEAARGGVPGQTSARAGKHARVHPGSAQPAHLGGVLPRGACPLGRAAPGGIPEARHCVPLPNAEPSGRLTRSEGYGVAVAR